MEASLDTKSLNTVALSAHRDKHKLSVCGHSLRLPLEPVTSVMPVESAGAGGGMEPRSGVGILLQAMRNGKLQLARFVIAALGETVVNAAVEGPASRGRTPLMFAIVLPRPSERECFLWLLLSRGAEVDRRDETGRTALSLASESGHLDAVRLLVEHGADPGAADQHGATPLAYAARHHHCAVVKFLLRELKAWGEEVGEVGGEEAWLLGEEQRQDGCLGRKVEEDCHGGQDVEEMCGVQGEPGVGAGCREGGLRCGGDPSPPLHMDAGCFLSESSMGDLLMMDDVICNPYALEAEEGPVSVEVRAGVGTNPRRSFYPSRSPLSLQSWLTDQVIPNPSLCQTRPLVPFNRPHSGPYQLGLHASKSSRPRFLSSWFRRGQPCPADHQLTPETHPNPICGKPSTGFWKWMTPRGVLSAAGSTCGSQSLLIEPLDPLQNLVLENRREPSFLSSLEAHLKRRPTTLRNRCFLDEECLGRGQTKVPLRAKHCSLPTEALSGRSGRGRGVGGSPVPPRCPQGQSAAGCNVFRVLRRHTSPEIRALLGESSDTELEELLPDHEK